MIIVLMISCKKNETGVNPKGEKNRISANAQTKSTAYARIGSQIGGEKVAIDDNFGFLEFNTTAECNSFTKNLVGKTHGEVRQFCQENKFVSLGLSKYSYVDPEETVNENQAEVYTLNQDGVVGLGKAALKIKDQTEELESWSEALIMKIEYLNPDTYANFSRGDFNLETMSRLFLGYNINADLAIFMDKNPQGYVSPESEGNQKFWGTGIVHHTTVNGCTYDCHQDYMFWIPVGVEYHCSESVCNGSF